MMGDRIKELARSVSHFPPIPGVATQILPILRDPEGSFSQVEKALRGDMGLTADILKLANSAYFGIPKSIGSVKHAIALLGAKRVSELVVASCVRGLLQKQVPGYDLSPGDLWRHSICVSVMAEALARELRIPSMDEAFTAGLLHDAGKLVLGAYVKDEVSIIEKRAEEGIPFQEAERLVLGMDHAEVGATILRKWSFPAHIVSAVRWHHDPDGGERPETLTDVVHVANMLSLMIGIGVGREGLRYEPSRNATKRLQVKTKELEKIASQTLDWINSLNQVF